MRHKLEEMRGGFDMGKGGKRENSGDSGREGASAEGSIKPKAGDKKGTEREETYSRS